MKTSLRLRSLLHPMQSYKDLAPLFTSTKNSNPNTLRGRSRDFIAIDGYNRRLADDDSVDYWRKRAGWFDDDESMTNYNAGVYDTYYSVDDDSRQSGSGGKGKSSGKSGASSASWYSLDNRNFLTNMITVVVGLISVIVFILLARAIRRRISPDGPSKTRRSAERSSNDDLRSRRRSASRSSRSRSKSRTRSRSRSRARSQSRARRREDEDGDDYKLMEDEPSRTRSKSRTRSSRSRSRSRKRVEEMLV